MSESKNPKDLVSLGTLSVAAWVLTALFSQSATAGFVQFKTAPLQAEVRVEGFQASQIQAAIGCWLTKVDDPSSSRYSSSDDSEVSKVDWDPLGTRVIKSARGADNSTTLTLHISPSEVDVSKFKTNVGKCVYGLAVLRTGPNNEKTVDQVVLARTEVKPLDQLQAYMADGFQQEIAAALMKKPKLVILPNGHVGLAPESSSATLAQGH